MLSRTFHHEPRRAENPFPIPSRPASFQRLAKASACCFSAPRPATGCPAEFAGSIAAVQGSRPLYKALEAAKTPVTPFVDGEDYDAALILCGKHKGENEDRIAEALKRTKVGGLIVVAGGKEDGIQSLRKRVAQLGWGGDSLPKYHGIAFWFGRPEDAGDVIARFAKKPVRVEGRFDTASGMFSHERIDAGSELLASRLPDDFKGQRRPFRRTAGAICR